MAGTVVVDNITTGTGATVPAATVVSGTAKAWVNFNGTGTVAIRASFNVSSITDNGTGDYTVNFTTAMPDANYAVNASTWQSTSTSNVNQNIHSLTANNFRIICYENNVQADSISAYISIFR